MPGEKMTKAQEGALRFMDDKLYVWAKSVGRAVYDADHARGSNLIAIGANVLGQLRKRGWAVYLSDVQSWRITPAGRQALAHRGRK